MSIELKWMGLSEQKLNDTIKNAHLTKQLVSIVNTAKELDPAENGEVISNKSKGTLLYNLATKIKPQHAQQAPLAIKHIMNGNIRNDAQLQAAVDFLLSKAVTSFTEEEFKNACGVGVVITIEQIEDEVGKVIEKYKGTLLKERYSFNVGKLLGEVKQYLLWADHGTIKQEIDLRILELLGPKTADELCLSKKKMAKTGNENAPVLKEKFKIEDIKKKEKSPELDGDEGAETEELLKNKTHFHKVGENYKTEGYVITPNTMKLLEKHVQAVGGKVTTRFPPEPNGILHIGHAKAININFGYAKAHGGRCYLRFDDTNPEKEEEKFFTGIADIVNWLGYTPYKVTHSSDNFDQLYRWAVELIRKDMAYVCHQKVEEMRGIDQKPSPWRNRPIAESLQLFEDMKNGKFDEGEATLRLKTTLEEGKMDPVAYRIKYVPHHRSRNKWCIYPTYDYTHCLCDSIENITHSLCTKEFQSRRSSYYWLCNTLDIYCPVQWEYGRLNVYYTVVSKRKILKLIQEKIVSDWDDPRLFTLTALRRRGIPPEAINTFVTRLGLTGAKMSAEPSMLDAVVRDYLNVNSPRTMAVLEPLRLRIQNFKELNLPTSIDVPDFPGDPSKTSTHKVAVDDILYIESTDFREGADKSYRRLSKTQPVGLKHIGLVLYFVDEIKDAHDHISEIVVRAEKLGDSNKPKAFIHWVCKPVACEVRLYNRLFKHKNPEDPQEVPGGFLSDCNPDSLKIVSNALIDRTISGSKVYDRYQFERIGFFAVDQDSTKDKLIFNRTVLLREDAGKN